MRRALFLGLLLVPALLHACSSGHGSPADPPDATVDSAVDGPGDVGRPESNPMMDAAIPHPCALPGSIQYTPQGVVVVPGGAATPDVGYLQVPVGFCVHYYATVGDARQLRFAPGGDLFVASPTTSTSGGGVGGMSGVVIVPDDNLDGVGDTVLTFLDALPSTQGLLFTGGYLYYQDGTKILRTPFAPGDRAPSGTAAQVADIQIYSSDTHWPKTLDVADDGTVYVSNGGDQGEACDPARPFHGGILKLDGTPGGTPVARGLRNPFAVRCARGHDRCFALELAKDNSMAPDFGREKLIPIHEGDDWGFPCCATRGTPYLDVQPVPDCSGVTAESAAFYIGHTPFGIDFEPGLWPAPWTGNAIVALHGAFSSWTGERVVAIGMDPTTGLPLASSDLDGGDTGAMTDFATGWDDGKRDHGRPAAVAFSKDGRLFLGNDNDGTIVWIAPLSL